MAINVLSVVSIVLVAVLVFLTGIVSQCIFLLMHIPDYPAKGLSIIMIMVGAWILYPLLTRNFCLYVERLEFHKPEQVARLEAYLAIFETRPDRLQRMRSPNILCYTGRLYSHYGFVLADWAIHNEWMSCSQTAPRWISITTYDTETTSKLLKLSCP